MSRARTASVRWARRALHAGAQRSPAIHRFMQVVAHEFGTALTHDVYGGEYFGEGRDATDRTALSGYERYDRESSNANVSAYLVWSTFPCGRSLDVGCATGFVVEALRELAFDAEGVDVSQYAIDHAAAGARGHIRWADLSRRLPFRTASFDVVTALETLEHLEPSAVPAVLAELRRVSRGWLFATIPSFGPNRNGPAGWYPGKVRPERVEHYESLGPEYEGPVAFPDLYRDARGDPIEGHLTVASFEWWTQRFADAGFVRCDATERRLQYEIARFGFTKMWNAYVFRCADVDEPPASLRIDTDRRAVQARFGLDAIPVCETDIELVDHALRSSG